MQIDYREINILFIQKLSKSNITLITFIKKTV